MDKNLPIFKHKDEIVKSINENLVTIITGSTGSGKSSCTTQFIIDENPSYKVLCTTPTRISALSLGGFVSKSRGSQIGEEVGFQIGGQVRRSRKTRIVYLTIGVLKERLVNNHPMNDVSHVMLDEIHERGLDGDTVMFLILKRMKHLLKIGQTPFKLILMSATVRPQIFQDYFGEIQNDINVINISSRLYKVKEIYLEKCMSFVGYKENSQEVKRTKEMFNSDGYFSLQHRPKLVPFIEVLACRIIEFVHRTEPMNDSFLIFLPGISEILGFERVLQKNLRIGDYDIHILHSFIPIEDQKRALAPCGPKQSTRKIILASPIAENSITVPDVKYVIDFCLFKEINLNTHNGAEELLIKWTSIENLDQRRGRAGRVKSGVCFRMIPKNYLNSLRRDVTPEILRISLSHLILRLIRMKLGVSPEGVLKKFITTPDLKNIEKAYSDLHEINAIRYFFEDQFSKAKEKLRKAVRITKIGEFLVSFPLSLQSGMLLYYGLVFGYLHECVLLAALSDIGGIMFVDFSRPIKNLNIMYSYAGDTRSDLFCSFFAYLEIKRKNPRNINTYCYYNGINAKKYSEAKTRVSMIYEKIDSFLNSEEERRKKGFVKVELKQPKEADFYYDGNMDIFFLKILICAAFQKNLVFLYKTERHYRSFPSQLRENETVSFVVKGKNKINANDIRRFCQDFDGGMGEVTNVEEKSRKKGYIEFSRKSCDSRELRKATAIDKITKFGENDFSKIRLKPNSRFKRIPYSKAIGPIEQQFLAVFYPERMVVSRFSILRDHLSEGMKRKRRTENNNLFKINSKQKISYLDDNDPYTFVFTFQNTAQKVLFVNQNTLLPINFPKELLFLLFANKVKRSEDLDHSNSTFLEVVNNANVFLFQPKFLNFNNLSENKDYYTEEERKDIFELINYIRKYVVEGLFLEKMRKWFLENVFHKKQNRFQGMLEDLIRLYNHSPRIKINQNNNNKEEEEEQPEYLSMNRSPFFDTYGSNYTLEKSKRDYLRFDFVKKKIQIFSSISRKLYNHIISYLPVLLEDIEKNINNSSKYLVLFHVLYSKISQNESPLFDRLNSIKEGSRIGFYCDTPIPKKEKKYPPKYESTSSPSFFKVDCYPANKPDLILNKSKMKIKSRERSLLRHFNQVFSNILVSKHSIEKKIFKQNHIFMKKDYIGYIPFTVYEDDVLFLTNIEEKDYRDERITRYHLCELFPVLPLGLEHNLKVELKYKNELEKYKVGGTIFNKDLDTTELRNKIEEEILLKYIIYRYKNLYLFDGKKGGKERNSLESFFNIFKFIKVLNHTDFGFKLVVFPLPYVDIKNNNLYKWCSFNEIKKLSTPYERFQDISLIHNYASEIVRFTTEFQVILESRRLQKDIYKLINKIFGFLFTSSDSEEISQKKWIQRFYFSSIQNIFHKSIQNQHQKQMMVNYKQLETQEYNSFDIFPVILRFLEYRDSKRPGCIEEYYSLGSKLMYSISILKKEIWERCLLRTKNTSESGCKGCHIYVLQYSRSLMYLQILMDDILNEFNGGRGGFKVVVQLHRNTFYRIEISHRDYLQRKKKELKKNNKNNKRKIKENKNLLMDNEEKMSINDRIKGIINLIFQFIRNPIKNEEEEEEEGEDDFNINNNNNNNEIVNRFKSKLLIYYSMIRKFKNFELFNSIIRENNPKHFKLRFKGDRDNNNEFGKKVVYKSFLVLKKRKTARIGSNIETRRSGFNQETNHFRNNEFLSVQDIAFLIQDLVSFILEFKVPIFLVDLSGEPPIDKMIINFLDGYRKDEIHIRIKKTPFYKAITLKNLENSKK